MSAAYDWLEARLGLRALKQALLDREVPERLHR